MQFKSSLNFCVPASLYLAINALFVLKYVGRISEPLALLAASAYAATFCLVVWLALRYTHSLSSSRCGLLLAMGASIVALAVAQYQIDPYSLRVDRWSAIHHFLDYLFQGRYPYAAQTHLGGYGSPFPVWQFFHIPFYLMGNVGLSVFVGMAAFVGGIWLLWDVRTAFGALVLLLVSPAFLYEVAVRSDLMTNFLLACALLCAAIRYRVSFARHYLWIALAAGLLMSTRLSAVIPLGIYYLRDYLKARWPIKLCLPVLSILVFAATFLPFFLWNSDQLLFFEYNPFVLQSRQGHLSDFLLFIPAGLWLALSWRRVPQLMTHTAVCLLLLVVVTFAHNMYLHDNWAELFESAYDITYFNMALPFLIVSLLTSANNDTDH